MMCVRIACEKCGKPSYAGCGRHVDQVLAGVPVEGRCKCREVAVRPAETGAERSRRSWLKDLLEK